MRVLWMRAMLRRDNRIADAALIGHVVHSAAFFASTSLIAIGAALIMQAPHPVRGFEHRTGRAAVARRGRARSVPCEAVPRQPMLTVACISQTSTSVSSTAVSRWPPVAVMRTASPVAST